jgi:hypothetical protein
MQQYDKKKSCKDCPDRCADPNCHDACKEYKDRTAAWQAQKADKMKSIEIWSYKHESITKDIMRKKYQKRKRYK